MGTKPRSFDYKRIDHIIGTQFDDRTNRFASSLVEQHREQGLTSTQWFWVDKLRLRAHGPDSPNLTIYDAAKWFSTESLTRLSRKQLIALGKKSQVYGLTPLKKAEIVSNLVDLFGRLYARAIKEISGAIKGDAWQRRTIGLCLSYMAVSGLAIEQPSQTSPDQPDPQPEQPEQPEIPSIRIDEDQFTKLQSEINSLAETAFTETGDRITNLTTVLSEKLNKNRDLMVDAVDKSRLKLDRAISEMNTKAIRSIKVEMAGRDTVDVGAQHIRFSDLLGLISSRVTPLMVGPAGSGKTEAARAAAKALSLPFSLFALGPQTTMTQIFGYMDATGRYVASEFRRRFEHGGLILLDELCRCNPRVSVTLNGAIGNSLCSFPDKMIERHSDCLIVAADNTAGYGADRQYVSAQQQDGATLNRFTILDWPYDEAFERSLALAHVADQRWWPRANAWIDRVQRVRGIVDKKRMRYIVSPRQSIDGVKCLESGCAEELVVDSVLFGGWSKEDRERVVGIEKEGE